MAELEVFNSILRTRDGGIYGLNVTQNFYFMRSPKLFVTITNPPAKDSTTGKGRYAKVFLDMTEVIGLIRKLKAGVAHNRSDQGKMELCKIYKGGRDNKRRFGVDIVSRIFTVYAEKGRIFMKIELSKGTQAMTKMMAGRRLNRPAAADSVRPATKNFAPSRPVTFFRAVARVRIVMAGTMFIKPVGIASMDSLKEIRRRHQ